MKKAADVCEVLTSLSNPTRLLIVCMLLNREMCHKDILEELGTTKGNISQHLKILTMKGLIKKRKISNQVFFSIADEQLREVVKTINDSYCGGDVL